MTEAYLPVSGFPLSAGTTSLGLRSRLIGYQVRVIRFGYGCGPEPEPGAEYPNQRPDD